MPFGFIDTGPDGTIVEDDGTVWDISDDDRFSL